MKKIITIWLLILLFFCAVSSQGKQLSLQEKIKVSKITLQGNVSLPDKELLPLTAPYENKEITIEELEALRQKLTRYYTDHGYINSGVIIQDQDVADGIITITIIEGKIIDTEITGNKWLHTNYVMSRLKSALPDDKAFNINSLEKRLKLLKQDRTIENINATISPGVKPGEAELDLTIEEIKPCQLTLLYNNYGSPGIGSFQGEAILVHNSFTGRGDKIEFNYKETKGFDNYLLNYVIPLTRFDTTLGFNYSKSAATVVSYPFNILDIKSETEILGVSLLHPFYKTLSREFTAGLTLEKYKSKTSLLDIPFSFTSHTDDYQTEVTELSFSQEWVSRSMNQVLAIRSDFKFGLDWLNSTIHEGVNEDGMEYADSDYFTWLGQMQWFRQTKFLNSSLLFKTNLQHTKDPQLSSGRFAIGGKSTVRGYRQNHMTTDNGIISSLEWRIPVLQLKIPKISTGENDGQIIFCPFFDYGKGWNVTGSDPEPDSIYSIGTGLQWNISKNFNAEIYYGYGLKKIESASDYDLQDDGIHFQIMIDIDVF